MTDMSPLYQCVDLHQHADPIGSMLVECGWCGAYMGQIDGKGKTDITSSICDPCLKKHFPRTYARQRRTGQA